MNRASIDLQIIKEQLSQHREHDQSCLRDFKKLLGRKLIEAGLEACISYRIKEAHSALCKIRKKGCELHNLTDRLGVRIIVTNVQHCYQAFELIKKNFPYLPQKIKDYIFKPKENGYQSLHLVVQPPCSPHNAWVEVQIRTWAMEYECLCGQANHWDYKAREISPST